MDANKNQLKHPKAVLITGAAGRIGLELAKECLELGYHVIAHYRSSPEPARSAFMSDKRVAFIPAELTEPLQKLMDEVKKLPVTLVGLINNAAVFQTGDISDPEHFVDTLSINTIAPLKLSVAFAKCVDNGWIINITDARTRHKNKKYQNYRVSKVFLDEITRQLAFLYAPSIRVNAIAPGAVLPADSEPPNRFADLSTHIPMGKTGNPSNIRQTLRFLIENNYVTGTVIPVDGGWGL
ncbi:MAG: SDR family oxidoreductase [Chitinispirillales bacterium]|jgi:NAD(P)-dependent dehydrogenase (short-subunit alcohol dehydrogenase family)|nr:SDR family oxidoreductase [Chitinispirillales bacterium]